MAQTYIYVYIYICICKYIYFFHGYWVIYQASEAVAVPIPMNTAKSGRTAQVKCYKLL